MAIESTVSRIPGSIDWDGNVEVDQDLKDYFAAICSYPDHVASQPELSFQRHLLNIMRREGRPLSRKPTRCRVA